MEIVGAGRAQFFLPGDGLVQSGAPEAPDAEHRASLPATQRLKTFIVEDSKLIRESLTATLEELSPVQVVGVAEDEVSAVQWLQSVGFGVDLIIVDIFLKSGSGLGVLRAAQGMPHLACKRVVLSNYATPDVRHKCLDLGADKVFDKSHDIDELILYCMHLADGQTGHNGNGNGALR